jgi:hypothetical protein
MSHLMDPDGTDRVIQRRITEWHRELEHERNARLLEVAGPGRTRRMLRKVADRLRTQVGRLTAAIRHAADRPIATQEPADATVHLVEGQPVP